MAYLRPNVVQLGLINKITVFTERKFISFLQLIVVFYNMVSTSRFNYAILGIATMWSVLIFILYSNSSASCSAETERLKMAVDRKDRFLELLRDQNDELKGKVSKLQDELQKYEAEKSAQENLYRIKRGYRTTEPNRK